MSAYDDTEDAALADPLKWQQKMTNHVEERSKLEIEAQYKHLKRKVYKYKHDITTACYSLVL